MRRLPALVAALLLPAAQPLLLCTALSTAALLVSQTPAQAQSQEAVGKVAQAITVRIEGATQGSGVLVKRDGNRYTVLTAWHVVSEQRPGEELDIYTPDGQRHQLEQGSIKRLGEVDMAVLTFSSNKSYQVARLSSSERITCRHGRSLLTAGFPVSKSQALTTSTGELLMDFSSETDQGYTFFYTNSTEAGMSGGPILSLDNAVLVGLHGRGEVDQSASKKAGIIIKTGINQGINAWLYESYASGNKVLPLKGKSSSDDLLATAFSQYLDQDYAKAVENASQSLILQSSLLAYFIRAFSRQSLGDYLGAIKDYTDALKSAHLCNQSRNPLIFEIHQGRAYSRQKQGDYSGSIRDYSFILDNSSPPWLHASSFYGRANARLMESPLSFRQIQSAIWDYSQAIRLSQSESSFYKNRGIAYAMLSKETGNSSLMRQACSDLRTANDPLYIAWCD